MGAVMSRLIRPQAFNYNQRYEVVTEYLIRVGGPVYSSEVLNKASRLTAYLHFAVKFHYIPEAIELIQLGAKPPVKNRKGQTTLQYAVVCKRYVEGVEKIIPNGIHYKKMKFYGLRSLRYATKARKMKRLRELAATQDDINSAHSLILVKMLLDHGSDVNNKDINACTPLHCAIYTGDLELVKMIISAGADINVQNRIGATPLHDAVLSCNEEMVFLLLSKGANVDAKTLEFRNSPLHWAAMLNIDDSHERVITRLLQFGSDMHAANLNGWTPFYYIIRCCDVNLVRHCIDK
ncbi:putative ankyrin repeat protein RF_0381 [Nasonia vitripennis]|uniref:Ankyrin repeat protein n=1 Tax=Nasonia vitripennis TaxID=7425 RepID=A0A7M7Q8E9_NASVI|nr:putative ankyrin repeat protein RF_0381 [Nasonia vitripennis]